MYTEIIEQDRGSEYREGLKNYSLRKWRKNTAGRTAVSRTLTK